MITDKENLKSLLNEGIYDIVFRKVSGDVRTMRCTLKADYLPDTLTSNSATEDRNVMTVWDLESNGWRRFCIDRVISKTQCTNDELPYVVNDFQKALVTGWLNNCNEKAEELNELYQRFNSAVRNTDETILYYLIFWQNGSASNAANVQVDLYKRELERRGKQYNEKIAEIIEKQVEKYY